LFRGLVGSEMCIRDSNIAQKEYSMDFYFGIAMIVGITGAICVYVNTLPEPIISEEILNGPPNF
jgi:hypothetical protein